MSRGLDIGTGGIVGATLNGETTSYKRLRNLYVEIKPNPIIKSMLKKSDIPNVEMNGMIYALGEKAMEIASAFSLTPHRPMAKGVINPQEANAAPILKAIIGEALGAPDQPGELCFFSVPADPVDAEFNAVYHRNVFEKMLKELGYKPEPINEGLAVIYSELLDHSLTGVGLSFGAGMCNVCCSMMGEPIFSFSVAASGDYIDQNVSTARAITPLKALKIKELTDLSNPKDADEEAVVYYYRHLINYVLDQIAVAYHALPHKPEFETAPPIAIAGGTAMLNGFKDLFNSILATKDIAFLQGAELVLSEKPLYSIAKGAMFAAISAEE